MPNVIRRLRIIIGELESIINDMAPAPEPPAENVLGHFAAHFGGGDDGDHFGRHFG